jgi:sodium/hydrogen exchanger-like protein 6/7
LQRDARSAPAARIGTQYYNHQQQAQAQAAAARDAATLNGQVFSSASSESYDSDGEVLPLATTSLHQEPASPGGHPPRANVAEPGMPSVGEDGKWFQALDERYLLPLFSNATASRTFHARRARRTASGVVGSTGPSVEASPVESDDEGGEDDDGPEVELGVPLDHRPRPGNIQTQSRVVEESRAERGLTSPMLRSNSSGERLEPDMT